MANVKSAGIREMIIDRCLQEPRGYTIEELKKRVNDALIMDGLMPVTSGNTIRNDIENIANRWKQAIRRGKRRQAITFRYDDPAFSIFQGQFTKGELRQLRMILQTIMFLDAYQGSIIYREMGEMLKLIIGDEHFQKPILFYENIPSEKDLRHFHFLIDCIHERQPVRIEYVLERREYTRLSTVHPYFMRQHSQQWHLLGNDHARGKVRCLALQRMLRVEKVYDTEFVPGNELEIKKTFFRYLVKV